MGLWMMTVDNFVLSCRGLNFDWSRPQGNSPGDRVDTDSMGWDDGVLFML